MSDAQLQIKIGADVKDAIAGMGQTGTAATSLGGKIKDVDQTFQVLNSTLNQSVGYMKQQRDAAQALASSESQLAVSTKEMAAAQDTAADSGKNMLGSISQQRVALVDLGRIATGTGFTVRSLGSQLALFPLPVVAAAAAIAFLASKLFQQTDAEKAAADAAKELQETISNLKSVSDIIGHATGSAAGDIETMRALVAAITDTTLSLTERNRALDLTKEKDKNLFGDLTLQTATFETLTKRLNEYTQGLISAAVVKGLSEEISNTTEEYNKQNDILQKLKSTYDNAQKAQTAFKPTPFVAGGRGAGGGTTQSALDQNRLAAATNIARDAFNTQRDAVERLSTAVANYRGQIQQSIEDQLKAPLLKEPPKPKADKSQDETLRFLEETKKNLEEIEAITSPMAKQFQQSLEGSLGNINAEILKNKIAKAISDGAKDGVSKARVDGLVNAMTGAAGKIANPNLSVPVRIDLIDTKALDDKLKTVVGRLDKDAFIKVQIDASKISPDLAALDKQLGDILSAFSAQAIEGVSEAIGTAIGSGGNVLKAAANEVESLIGAALENMGKALIAYGLAGEAVQISLTSLQPEVAIAAGIAAEVAGAALKASTVHAFADGGIVTAPTLGLVGEAGPEVIFPLSKLQQFAKGSASGGGRTLNIKGEISGQNLKLVLARANKNQNMV